LTHGGYGNMDDYAHYPQLTSASPDYSTHSHAPSRQDYIHSGHLQPADKTRRRDPHLGMYLIFLKLISCQHFNTYNINWNLFFCFRITIWWREWLAWPLPWAAYWQWGAHETSTTSVYVIWRKPRVWVFYTKFTDATHNQRNYCLNAVHCPMCIVF